MDSFDGLFLEEIPKENNIDITLLDEKIGSHMSVGVALLALVCQPSAELVNSRDELDMIFVPSTPYVLDPGDIYFGKEDTFDRTDEYKNEKIEKPSDHIEMNIKPDQDPRMIKIRKGTSKKRRKNEINLVKDLTDNIVHDEFNSKEYAKPFKEKSKGINYKHFQKGQRRIFNNSS
jgi:hypothetical protein